MAAYSSLLSTFFHSSSSPSSPFPRFSTRKSISFPSKSLSPNSYPIPNPLILSFLHHNSLTRNSGSCSNSSRGNNITTNPSPLHKLLFAKNTFSSALDSLLVLCASLALSFSLFIADVDSAFAFVVTPPRKLQSDELATVRLFQDNTPSVVYITNLAVRYTLFAS